MTDNNARDTSLDLISFIKASPTAAHAVIESSKRLTEAGFIQLDEGDQWNVQPGDNFFVIRNHSSIIAARMGTQAPDVSGFRLACGHTDFPSLKLKPNGVYSKEGYLQFGVEIYGGTMLHTWLDRDLGIAGNAIVIGEDGKSQVLPFAINKPVCRIPNLAPHIRVERTEEVKFNKQDHIPPVFGMGGSDALDEKPIIALIAESIGTSPEKISSYNIEIFDIQPGVLGGINEEFVFTRSIDNLAACHAAIESLINSTTETPFTKITALFDHEEIGSGTMQGAGSRFLDNTLERLSMGSDGGRESFFRSINNSIMASIDGAHAVNPNYPDAHEPKHHLFLNGGPVIKVNAQERYTTQIDAHEHIKTCASENNIPLQYFVARTDVGTGSTIGPMTASRLGLKSVDLGNPMISMHSIREMGGVEDQLHMINLLNAHFTRV